MYQVKGTTKDRHTAILFQFDPLFIAVKAIKLKKYPCFLFNDHLVQRDMSVDLRAGTHIILKALLLPVFLFYICRVNRLSSCLLA
jgi:hypothetical protein